MRHSPDATRPRDPTRSRPGLPWVRTAPGSRCRRRPAPPPRSPRSRRSCARPPRSRRGGRSPCAASFVRPLARTSSVSAAKPTITWPGRARSAEISARMSGLRTRTIGSGSWPSFFLIFPAAYAAGRKSATAAAITTASASGAALSTASRSCTAVPTCTTSTPAGSGMPVFAAIRVTRAPRAAAVRARAYPCLPEERLPRKRTGSSGSRVPPALTTTCRPARSGSVTPRASTRRQTSKISDGFGQPPLAGVHAGQAPHRRVDDHGAAAAQRRHVLLGGRVLPHLGVHGGGEDDRAPGGEQCVRQQVVGEAVGGLREHVGGGGGDDDQVGPLPDADVRDLVDVRPDLGRDGVAGERGPGRGADEVQRGLRRDDPHVVPRLGQSPQQLTGLVRGDATADPQHDLRLVHVSPRTSENVRPPSHTTGPAVALPGLWKNELQAENTTAPGPRWPPTSADPR